LRNREEVMQVDRDGHVITILSDHTEDRVV
jgi:hypothetical protein